MFVLNQFRDMSSSATGAAAADLLADIRELAPSIAARAAEIEAGRRIPPDLVKVLRSIGSFRLFVPRSHGGLEFDLPTALEIISAFARIDGSIGWTVMIDNSGGIFAPVLARETYEQVYRNGPDAIFAGSLQPAGMAEPIAGGLRVSGRWPFASGCQHADWMVGFCVMTEGGKPIRSVDGALTVRGILLPACEWQIEDTWHVAGLKGTGSHHIALQDTLVPAANVFDLADGVPCQPGPIHVAALSILPLLHGAFVVGMAEGSLDDLIALANSGRQQLRAAVPMRESEMFQGELGRIAADVRAARAFLQVQAASHWQQALAGTLKDEARHAEGAQAATWIATTGVRVAGACFMLGGGSAIYESSPLQRRLRDMHVAAQHAAAQQRQYPGIGKLLLKSAGD